MNTKNLETLMAIIETGSFQKAATRMDYTPSAVTSQIKQLENELSIKLFEKIGRKMELTSAAKDVLPFIKAILQNVEQLNNYKKDISEITGTLRLVAPDSIFIYNMQPIIKEIMHSAPNIRLIVNSLPSNEINQAIIDGSADIGIDCDKGNFPDSLVHKSLRSVAACLIAFPFCFTDNQIINNDIEIKNNSLPAAVWKKEVMRKDEEYENRCQRNRNQSNGRCC